MNTQAETPDHWMRVNPRPNLRMVCGEGSYLWDAHGKRYLDFIQGWAVNCLGHSPEPVRAAITRQLDAVMNVGPALYNAPALELVTELARRSGLDRAFLGNSGAEANEGAVKLARKWGQRHRPGAYEVITTLDSFHGRTLAMTCATGKAGWEDAYPPRVEGFPKVPYGDVDAAARAISPRTVAVLVEPIQGEAGAVTPARGYLTALRKLCDDRGILLMLDEVQTGVYRTGPAFACQEEDVLPDVMTLGKGLGGGLPISAVVARESACSFQDGDHGSTFGGNAVCSAAALAVLAELSKPEVREQREASARYLAAALQRLSEQHDASLRGRGHLWGMVLPSDRAPEIRDRAFNAGLLVNAARPNVLRFMPALNVALAQIDEMIDLLSRVMRD